MANYTDSFDYFEHFSQTPIWQAAAEDLQQTQEWLLANADYYSNSDHLYETLTTVAGATIGPLLPIMAPPIAARLGSALGGENVGLVFSILATNIANMVIPLALTYQQEHGFVEYVSACAAKKTLNLCHLKSSQSTYYNSQETLLSTQVSELHNLDSHHADISYNLRELWKTEVENDLNIKRAERYSRGKAAIDLGKVIRPYEEALTDATAKHENFKETHSPSIIPAKLNKPFALLDTLAITIYYGLQAFQGAKLLAPIGKHLDVEFKNSNFELSYSLKQVATNTAFDFKTIKQAGLEVTNASLELAHSIKNNIAHYIPNNIASYFTNSTVDVRTEL